MSYIKYPSLDCNSVFILWPRSANELSLTIGYVATGKARPSPYQTTVLAISGKHLHPFNMFAVAGNAYHERGQYNSSGLRTISAVSLNPI